MEWTWAALPWMLVLVVCWGMAFVVLGAGQGRPQARWLAALLWTEGALGVPRGLGHLVDDAASTYGLAVLDSVIVSSQFPIYLLFFGTLGVPATRPLARPLVRRVLLGFLVVGPLTALAFPPLFVAVAGQAIPAGLWTQVVLTLLVYALGIVVSLSVLRAAPRGTARRRQAVAYAAAFLIYDAYWTATALRGLWAWRSDANFIGDLWDVVGAPAADLAWALLLGYGMLRGNLFDIDLRVKWGIRRGTLVGVFLAAYFVVSAVAQQFLEQYGMVFGGLAVGLLLFAVRPIERAADRLADRAMPHVRDTAEYRLVKKREVYRAAVESALAEGDVTPKERGMLATLASELGLDPREMHEIESDARTARGVA